MDKTALKTLLEKLLKIDRRFFFVLITVALFIPIIRPLNLANKAPGKEVRRVYDKIESMPAGSFVLLSLDFDPSTRPELFPQAVAVLRHAFKKNHRVMVMYFLPAASGIVEEIFQTVPQEFGKKEGVDYVVMPYQPNYSAVLTQMGSNLYAIYDKDRNGNDTRSMPVMKGILKFKDMDFAMCITGTALLDAWVALASDKFKFPLAGGVTAVSQPGYGPYLQTGQLLGLLGGMKGAADYENLLQIPGKGTSGIDALNVGHFIVLGLIVFSNAIIFIIKLL